MLTSLHVHALRLIAAATHLDYPRLAVLAASTEARPQAGFVVNARIRQ